MYPGPTRPVQRAYTIGVALARLQQDLQDNDAIGSAAICESRISQAVPVLHLSHMAPYVPSDKAHADMMSERKEKLFTELEAAFSYYRKLRVGHVA